MLPEKPKFRDDCSAIRKVRHGEVEFVIKDPIKLEYYRLSEFEYGVLTHCDGTRDLKQLLFELNRGKPDDERLQLDELRDFLESLEDMSLFEKSGAEKNAMIMARVREDRKNVLMQKKGSITYKRIPVIDPNHYFNWLEPKIRFFWTPWFMLISLAIMFGAGLIIVANWEEVSTGIIAIFTFQQDNAWGYVTLWIIVLVVIALHEHAHGLTCKHFGGEVRELGFLFMFFQPCMYANVSDAWTFADRGKRIWVTVAGGYFEFFIGALCTYVWWLTAPGTTINALTYQAMTVCGFSSVLFNFNPLIKLDGYYILCDFLEVHNLKTNSVAYVKSKFKHVMFGIPEEDNDFSDKEKRAYLIYGIASTMYIAALLTGIWFLVSGLLIPSIFGLGMALSLFLGWKLFGRYIKNTIAFTFDMIHKMKPIITSPRGRKVTALVILGIIGFFCLPVVHRIEGTTQLKPIGEMMVRARTGGTLKELHKTTGERVKAGEVLAVLEDESLLLSLRRDENRMRKLEIEMAQLDPIRDQGEREQTKRTIAQLEQSLLVKREDVANLTLIAPIDGVIVSTDLEERIGAYIARGAPFCNILDPSVMRAEVTIDARDVADVTTGKPAAIHLKAFPELTFLSPVAQVIAPETADPTSKNAQAGIPGKFRAVIDFDNSVEGDVLGRLRAGMTGTASIDVGRRLLIMHLVDKLRQNLKADVLFF